MAEIARFKLRKPVVAHGNVTVTELVLQEPTGGLYLELGDPVRRIYEVAKPGEVPRVEQILKRDVCTRYIAELSALKSPLLVAQMHPADIDQAISALIAFFRFDDPTTEIGGGAEEGERPS